jgi:hypothetical protein
MRFELAVVMVCSFACSGPAPRVAEPREGTVLTRCDAIEVAIDDGAPLAAYGATTYPLSIVPSSDDIRVLYPAAYDDPIASALADGPIRAAPREVVVEPGVVLDQPRRVPRAMVAAQFIGEGNADIVFALRNPWGRFVPRAIEASEAFDRHPQIVDDGTGFGIAWLTGSYPQPEHLAFVRLDRDGHGEPRVVVRDARALPPIALVVARSRWLVFYANHLEQRGLTLAVLDLSGALVETRTIAEGRISDPVAAYSGVRGTLAFQDHDTNTVKVVAFNAEGALIGETIEVERDEDAELTPLGLGFDSAVWVATIAQRPTRTMHAVRSAGGIAHAVERYEPEARIARIDGDRVLHTTVPAASIQLASTGEGVRGVLVEGSASSQGALRSFRLRCAD